jgi:ABC-2 type transport system permease protein
MAAIRYSQLVRFGLYLVAIVLVSIAGQTLFFRLDLTRNGIYSLSETSRQVVATLKEPLTINVFFTQNLPAPHNNTERYLRDLLEEYAVHANRNFNFRFYNVTPQESDTGGQSSANQKLADDYGINPVQIQVIEEDEVKFKRAYMGLVLIHGDLVERIPTLTSTDGLEYKLTTKIQKLNNKISALLNLKDKLQVTLFLSSSLKKVAPYMGINQLDELAPGLEKMIAKINRQTYDSLAFRFIDPSTDVAGEALSQRYQIMKLNWPDIPDAGLQAGNGVIGLVMEYGGKVITTPLINVFRIPIVGTQYQLVSLEEIEPLINGNIDALVNINANLGYLAGHGTLSLGSAPGRRGPGAGSLESFRALVSDGYSLQSIDLDKGPIPASLKCLVIARPEEPFSDYALYQIDQALMRGTRLALFLDTFKEDAPAGPQAFMAAPGFRPIDSGLEKLLTHYGLKIAPALVLDQNCYQQRLTPEMGGGQRPIYFAPIIRSSDINQSLPYMQNIRGLIALKMSPLEIDTEQLKQAGVTAQRLFSSSAKAWEMKDQITLDPMMIGPPPPADQLRQFDLAYMLEGEFPSFFKGQPIPAKPAPKSDATEGENLADSAAPPAKPQAPPIEATPPRLDQGRPSKILVVGSAELLQDTVLESEGRSPNAMFVMNAIDYLNDRLDIARMRSKEQRFNPLDETGGVTRAMTKAVNIVGLPILVIFGGLLVWLRRIARKKRIAAIYLSQTEPRN